MEGRRMRRSGRGQSNQTVLPLRAARRLSNTISCWYCDFKFSMLNEPLFLFGRRYSRYFRSWFSMGVGFSLAALLGVTLILLWEMGKLLHLYNGETQFVTLLSGSLFGGLSGLTISLADIGYLCISTIVSVSVHELGHALAAASEGIQMEYIAVFLAVLFPGALVAFNDEILQALPKSAALRIYCAGIWHNAGLCAVCAISLFILPLIFYPVYIHGEGPMVLDVASTSPLSRYLSPNDVIHSVDGIRINTVQEWLQIATSLTMQEYQGNYSAFKTSSGTGYCVPYSLLEKRIHVQLRGNETTCPNDLIAFVATSCPELRLSGDWRMENMYCLYAKDILKLEKCGDGWAKTSDNRSSCLCSQEESCLAPVLLPGIAWVEITYLRPFMPGCHQFQRTHFLDDKNSDFGDKGCFQSFLFIGDVESLLDSVHMTSYQPRWPTKFGAQFPNVLEKLLMLVFHVSLTLALLNSLPVYFLDGESILELMLQYLRFLSPRKRRVALKCCLLGGTFISTLIIFWNFTSF
ncbi:membrane-bound transcription factor site-2 protease homolog [Ipomoea triloba]|uniref:membrane-bound transcription factor site-2 protease homolog n=1 Tax=Ipomoea triloba TaxID=35885 RepID=UPI00125D40D6|nr:membrane-bound transcription factor site-2 protease homolog [Ipomoea triloba]XP_031107713.1 membrane-bound transcription factor site-2 protease homolog [Ipomoea triloba]